MPAQIQGFELSPQQKRLWSLQQDSPVYQAYTLIQIDGNLSIPALQAAINQTIARYEILRTNFVRVRGVKLPIQAIQAPAELVIATSAITDIEVVLQNVRQRSVDWEQGPLLQVQLFQRSPQQHFLLLSLPALCADRPALNYLFSEIISAYHACLEGQELTDEPLQYADLAAWQNELLAAPDSSLELNINLAKIQQSQLPYARIGNFDWQPDQLRYSIPAELVQKIANPTCLLTCWHILLWRLTQQSDLVIGVAGDGRNYQELQASLGLLTKYLPLQIFLTGSDRWEQVLSQVTNATQKLQEWQETFSWDQLSPDENIGFLLYGFEFEQRPESIVTGKISWAIADQYVCEERFQVKLTVIEQGENLFLEFHYDAQALDRKDVERLANQYLTLLTSALEQPDQAIAQLNLLSPQERQQILVDFNPQQTIPLPYTCVHQWFEDQVQRTPNRVAAICCGQELTYTDLNQRANQLAHYLQKQGIQPDILVGICLERSLDMLVAVLAVLKAGGAYVPLEPTYPTARLTFILNDAQVPLLLTQEKFVEHLPTSTAKLFCLDRDWSDIAGESQENLHTVIAPENLAYVIYTSGSTGQPKGTLIPHHGLINYLAWCTQAYAVEEGEGTVVHSPLAFDLTVTGLFSPLLVGSSVEMLPTDVGVESLHEALCRRSDLSLVKLTPAQLTLLAHQLPKIAAGSTKALIIGGENLRAETLSFWQNYAPETIIVNEYGPTETVVGCCVYQTTAGEVISGSVPIGRAIANTQLYVLDDSQQPVPLGVSGELYIGGAGVARGYLHRPALTAEKFVPHPLSSEPGARLYRTGDLVRYRTDGILEFLGRIDEQVKIRGFRIEPEEIAAVLGQHPEVAETTVVAQADHQGELRLVAYVVPKAGATSSPTNWRQFLQQQLPEYMLPSAFVSLKSLPLTANGKVDRRALPQPSPNQNQPSSTPQTPIAEIVAGIWSQVLGREGVGLDENFFELGGHSLLVTQVVAQVRQILQVELPPRWLFEYPTVAALTEQMTQLLGNDSGLQAQPIELVKRHRLPLSFAQQRLWLLDRLETDARAYIGTVAIHLVGVLDVAVLTRTLNEIVQRHEVLRTSFTIVDGEPVQAIALSLTLALPEIDLRQEPAAERLEKAQNIAAAAAQQPFDLSQPPLLRTTLLRLNDQEYLLLLTIHHIISDAWSAGVLIQEVTAIYTALTQGKPSPLASLPIQYADFAVWQRQWLQGEILAKQLAYWKQQLVPPPPTLKLPVDQPSTATTTAQGAKYRFSLPLTLSAGLKTLSQKTGVTLFMTLLAGFQTLLHYYTKQTDIAVGCPIANRDRAEVQGLIGFFVNTLVLRTDFAGNPSFRELLARVRSIALDAYSHQDLPFEKLVAEIQPERHLSQSPLFNVWFVLQTALPPLELPGLILTPSDIDNGVVRHDLKLDITETSAGLTGFFEYKTDLFDVTAIARITNVFITLLNTVVTQTEMTVSELIQVLAHAEQQFQIKQAEEFQMTRRQKLMGMARRGAANQA